MTQKIWAAIGLLFLIIAAGVALVLIPAPAEAPVTSPLAVVAQGSWSDRVSVSAPLAGASVDKTFTVSGTAPGPWYFEASFPIEVQNPQGVVVGTGIAAAQGEWMTENDVAFVATVSVQTYSGPALLILKRDNPSALPENDGSITIPIVIQ